MLSLEEAQASLLAAAETLPAENISLAEAYGHYLAQDIGARLTQPPFAASAMDGYAIRFDDLPGPWRIVGEAAAGRGFEAAVRSGEAVRIFTGAPLPAGADTVLIQEDAERSGERLRLVRDGPPRRGAHVRAKGADFMAGDRLATAGTRVTHALAGLLAAAGIATASVHRRPRVVLIATGNELVPPGASPKADQIVNSNGVMLAGLFREAGAAVEDRGIVRDDLAALTAAVEGAAGADLLVTVGGASVGDHDLVVPALESAGATIGFWKVAMRPGKPMLSGRLGACRVLGLPGNPVSAYVCALLFGLPLLRAMSGAPRALPRTVEATAAVAIAANGERHHFIRATVGAGGVTPAGSQDSSLLGTLASSNALLVRPPHAPPVAPGEQVVIIPLDSPSLAS